MFGFFFRSVNLYILRLIQNYDLFLSYFIFTYDQI